MCEYRSYRPLRVIGKHTDTVDLGLSQSSAISVQKRTSMLGLALENATRGRMSVCVNSDSVISY